MVMGLPITHLTVDWLNAQPFVRWQRWGRARSHTNIVLLFDREVDVPPRPFPAWNRAEVERRKQGETD
jgi:hypothetical protein